MKFLRSAFAAVICGAMALTLVSCGDYVGKEKSHPLFAKAGACKESGNYKDSAKYYEDFLLVCPKSAKTHLILAGLYSDNLEDPIRAIYNYQRYIEISTTPPSDSADISNYIDACKKKAAAKLNEEQKATPEFEKVAKDLEDTKAKLGKYVTYSQQLKEQNEYMKKLIGGKGKGSSAMKTAPSAASPAISGAAADRKTKADTYKTKAGDTVESIAKTVYSSASYAKLIRDANKGLIPSNGKFKAGVVLKIPPLPAPAKTPADVAPAAPAAGGAKQPVDETAKLGEAALD